MTSPRDPVEVVRDIYDAFARSDYDAILPELHPDCEFRNPEHAIEPGIRRGPAEFRRALESTNQMLDFTVDVEEVRRFDERIVVGYRATGRGKGSGVPIDQRFGSVWVFEDGKVRTFEWFASFEDALDAASP